MENKNDLTTGSIWKKMMIFSLPLIASNTLQVLFNMSDIAVVGKFSGADSLGAVGSTSILVTLFTGIVIGLGNGVNVIVARLIGQRHYDELKSAVKSSFITCLIGGIFVFLTMFFGSKFFLQLINTKEELIDKATTYLLIYSLGMPALAIYNFGNGCFSASGNTRKPLIYLFIAGIMNVILNLFFVIVLKLDVVGVAIASIISQYTSATLITISLMRYNNECKLIFSYKTNIKYVKQVLHLGLPAGIQNSIFAIANLFIQSGVNSFDTVMVEGNSAAANFDSLVYDVMAAFYMSTSSFIGQNYGAMNKKRVKDSYLISMLYAFIAGLILGALLMIFKRQFLSIFTNDQEVIEAGVQRINIMAFSYAFSSTMDTSIAASRGLGKTIVSMIIVISGSCIFRVAWIYTIFAFYHTIASLYLLYIFSWLITGFFELIYFIYCYNKIFNKKDKLNIAL